MRFALPSNLPSVISHPARSAETGARPSAAFVAHLIATAQQLPQTRARRRTGADQAASLYAAAHRRRRAPMLERLL
jgi:hypothetical protein